MKTLFLAFSLMSAGCATSIGPMSRGWNASEDYAAQRACMSRATTFHTQNICQFGVARANEIQAIKVKPTKDRQYVETRKASYED